MKYLLLVPILLGFLLSGCGVLQPRTPEYGVGPGPIYHSSKTYKEVLKKEIKGLKEKPECCSTFKDVNYTKISKISQSAELDIGNKSKAHTFPTGKSYVQGIHLPESKTPYNLRIISNHETDDVSVTSGGFFYPVVSLLNSNYEVVKTISADKFDYYSKEGFGFQTDSGLRTEIELKNKLLKEAKYLIVYTTDELMKKKTRYLFTGSRVYRAPDTEKKINEELRMGRWLVIAPNVPVGIVKIQTYK